MTESKVFPPKTPLEILQAVLTRLDRFHCLYGAFLYRLIDPSQSLEVIPRQINVQIARDKHGKFVQFLEDTGFLRSSTTRSNTLMGEPYTQSFLELDINGTLFSLEVLATRGNHNLKPWNDFTCNNLALLSKATGTVITLRTSDPYGKLTDEQFMGRCIRDICAHKLVPMCPDAHLKMNEKTHPHIRRQYVKMVHQAIHLMAQGWTLEPSPTGKSLEFTRYTPVVPPDACVICQEKMTELAVSLVCGHSFHIDCLRRQMSEDGPTSYKCCLCTKHILFSGKPETKESKRSTMERPTRVPVTPVVDVTPTDSTAQPTTSSNPDSASPNSGSDRPSQSPQSPEARQPVIRAVVSSLPDPHSTGPRILETTATPIREWTTDNGFVELTNDEIRVRGRHVVSSQRRPSDVDYDAEGLNHLDLCNECRGRASLASSSSSCSSESDCSDCHSHDSHLKRSL